MKCITEPAPRRMASYRAALTILEAKFRGLREEAVRRHERPPIDTIKTRIKDVESIGKKLRRLGFSHPADSHPAIEDLIDEQIHDIAGIRVICPFRDDVYALADFITRQDDITILETKDYIARPKESGYRSLHIITGIPVGFPRRTLVKVEVQLRTIAMDFWASLEHTIRYKKDIDGETVKTIAAELQECAETSAKLDLTMQRLREYTDTRSGNAAKRAIA